VSISEPFIRRPVATSLLTDVIWASAGIWPRCRSSGVVTAETMVSALAPGSSVETTMVG